jgi:hypothetical protein
MYDGQRLWDAMQRAIDRCEDPLVLGELYAELAFETTGRAGMWTRFPDRDLVQGWIDRALEMTGSGTRARAQALIALGYWQDDRPAWAVDEAQEVTERLGEPGLMVDACEVRCFSEFAAGRYQDALQAAVRAFDLERGISDPNSSTRLRESVAALFTMCGRLPESRRMIEDHDALCSRLFPHHRLHAVALEIEFLELLGEWEMIRALVPRARTAVRENLATPCVRAGRSLLVCSAACARLGGEPEAASLEREADELDMEGYGWVVEAPRIRLALHRHDLATVGRLVSESTSAIPRRQIWYFPAAVATYLDALAALGDARRLEVDAAEFLETDSVLTAFAMRALGVVRRDPSLIEEAASRFESFGFDAQAGDTKAVARPARPRE